MLGSYVAAACNYVHLDPYAASCSLVFFVALLFVVIPPLRGWTPLATASDWVVITAVMISDRGVFGSVLRFGSLRVAGTLVGAGLGAAEVLALVYMPPSPCLVCSWKPYIFGIIWIVLSYFVVHLKLQPRWKAYDYGFQYTLLTFAIVTNTAYILLDTQYNENVGYIMSYALARSIAILIGVGIASLFGLLLSPRASDKAVSGNADIIAKLAAATETTIDAVFLTEEPLSRSELENLVRPKIAAVRKAVEALGATIDAALGFEFRISRSKGKWRVRAAPLVELLRCCRVVYNVLADIYHAKLSLLYLDEHTGNAPDENGAVMEDVKPIVVEGPDGSLVDAEADGDVRLDLRTPPPMSIEPSPNPRPPLDRSNTLLSVSAPPLSALAVSVAALLRRFPAQRDAIVAAKVAAASYLRALSSRFDSLQKSSAAEPDAEVDAPMKAALEAFESAMATLAVPSAPESNNVALLEVLVIWGDMDRVRALLRTVDELGMACPDALAELKK
ncbi:hypothetical protein DFJ74DRAFT_531478 [Hyaloraphidium curvatum]|nr:hypothetical protein DFJ74DRAFT_531478 [Hyaloraphidium curvatum]